MKAAHSDIAGPKQTGAGQTAAPPWELAGCTAEAFLVPFIADVGILTRVFRGEGTLAGLSKPAMELVRDAAQLLLWASAQRDAAQLGALLVQAGLVAQQEGTNRGA